MEGALGLSHESRETIYNVNKQLSRIEKMKGLSKTKSRI